MCQKGNCQTPIEECFNLTCARYFPSCAQWQLRARDLYLVATIYVVPLSIRRRQPFGRGLLSLLSYISEIIDKILKCGFCKFIQIYSHLFCGKWLCEEGWGRKGLKGAGGLLLADEYNYNPPVSSNY